MLTDFQFFSGLLIFIVLYLGNSNNSKNSGNSVNNGSSNSVGNGGNSGKNYNRHTIFQLRETPATIPQLVPLATQGVESDYTYRKVGTVYSEDPTEDSIYLLEGRKHPYNHDLWQYRVLTTSGSSIGNYSIPIYLNNSEPTAELYTGDSVTVKGKESIGNFLADMNRPDPLIRF